MDNRSRFFKPFNRLGAAFADKVQDSGGLLHAGHTLLTVAGNGAYNARWSLVFKDSASAGTTSGAFESKRFAGLHPSNKRQASAWQPEQ
jgi:hypothetical protein